MMRPYFSNDDLFIYPSAKKYDLTDGLAAPDGVGEYGWVKTSHAWWYNPDSTSEPLYVASYGMNYWVHSVKGTAPGGHPKELHWPKGDLLRGSLWPVPLFMDSMWMGGYQDAEGSWWTTACSISEQDGCRRRQIAAPDPRR